MVQACMPGILLWGADLFISHTLNIHTVLSHGDSLAVPRALVKAEQEREIGRAHV